MFDRFLDYLEYKYNSILIKIYQWSIPLALAIIAIAIGAMNTSHPISAGRLFTWLAGIFILSTIGKKEKRERDALEERENFIMDDGTIITYPGLYAFFDINEIKCTADGKLIDNMGTIDSFAKRRDVIIQVMRQESSINEMEATIRTLNNAGKRQLKDVFEGMWIALQTQADKLKAAAKEGACEEEYARKMVAKIMEARDACVAIDAFCAYLIAVEKAKGTLKYVKFGVIETHLRGCLWRAKNIA